MNTRILDRISKATLAAIVMGAVALSLGCQQGSEEPLGASQGDGRDVGAGAVLPVRSRASGGSPIAQAREPASVRVTVPEGTGIRMHLSSPIGSGTSQVGDSAMAMTTAVVLVGDRVAIPVGSTVRGTVTDVSPAKKGLKNAVKGGSIVLSFTTITTPAGNSVSMSGSVTSIANSKSKTAGIIGGSAAGGAILGKILGGDTKDAAIGAVVGGAIGTGIAAGTKGREIVMPVGTELTVTLDRSLTIDLRR